MSFKKAVEKVEEKAENTNIGGAAVTPDSVRRFSKQQLLSSKKFSDRKDLLNAVLSENEKYTVEAAEEKIKQFLKGKVK